MIKEFKKEKDMLEEKGYEEEWFRDELEESKIKE